MIERLGQLLDRIVGRLARYQPAAPAPPPATVLVSGQPVPEDGSHTKLKANGQQSDYVVLTAEERAKGYVRPVRSAYRHVGMRPRFPIRDLTPEERAQHGHYGYVKHEDYPESERPLVGRFWTAADLVSGCGVITTMARPLAETYARDPKFYGGTFCAGCGKHFHLEQFVWEGTNERVGS